MMRRNGSLGVERGAVSDGRRLTSPPPAGQAAAAATSPSPYGAGGGDPGEAGAYAHGLRHGRGVAFRSLDDSVYLGDWWLGREHGQGVELVGEEEEEGEEGEQQQEEEGEADGSMGGVQLYRGGWHEGARRGFGALVGPSCRLRYSGQWLAGMYHGEGRWARGRESYEGSFEGGVRSGFGVHETRGGDRDEGEWLLGRRHGVGRLLKRGRQPKILCGEFAAGDAVGELVDATPVDDRGGEEEEDLLSMRSGQTGAEAERVVEEGGGSAMDLPFKVDAVGAEEEVLIELEEPAAGTREMEEAMKAAAAMAIEDHENTCRGFDEAEAAAIRLGREVAAVAVDLACADVR